MSAKRLDWNRKMAIVYGGQPDKDGKVPKYMQDRMFFTGNGMAIGATHSAGRAVPVPSKTPVEVVELAEEPSGVREMLAAKTVPALKKMAQTLSEATGTELPENGPGVKARLINYIADNTE